MELRSTAILLLLHLMVSIKNSSQQDSDCEFGFSAQPLSEIPCNPYQHELRINCTAEGLRTDGSYDVSWFRRMFSNQQVELLTHESPATRVRASIRFFGMTNSIKQWQTQIRIAKLIEEDTGHYWCEIRPRDESLVLANPRSNILTLRSRATYESLQDCGSTEVFTAEVDRCVFPADPSIMTPDFPLTAPSTTTANIATVSMDLVNTQDTTKLADSQSTTISVEESPTTSNQSVAIYSVLAVIVVFCAVINLVLIITIVILYRRRHKHVNTNPTPDLPPGVEYEDMGAVTMATVEYDYIQTDNNTPSTTSDNDSMIELQPNTCYEVPTTVTVKMCTNVAYDETYDVNN